MTKKVIWLFLLCVLLQNSRSNGEDPNCSKETRCSVSRAHRLKAIDCYNRNFKAFPKCIPTDAQVIELSFNRIRKVSKSDLSRFKYLEILYLTDNLIVHLDEDAFKELGSLHTLDLSINALNRLPSTLFQLPSLKTLYLSQNLNINIADSLEGAKPISGPLTTVDISLTTDEDNISEFPDFGVLPFLANLNITGNQYTMTTPKHFAGLCNLQLFINTNVTTDYGDSCDCWIINNWLKKRKVKFTPFVCPVSENKCQSVDVKEEDMAIYKNCLEAFEEIQRRQRVWKIAIGVGVGILALIVITIVCLYYFWLRKKWRKDKGKNTSQANITPQPDGLRLLNNQTKILTSNT